ncbi:MAG: pro-sigmaK processing inhibitor BofA family protein [Eubacteriales bacterium]|nr:pro-sigmaK processing inhibitor BofA family protein [Eubacteriales bacterium]
MGLGIDFQVILFFALGLVLLYFTGWLLLAPLKIILKLIISGILGGILLWLINLLGGIFSVTIAINPISALVAGYFGVPGIILLLVLKLVLI